MNRIPRLTDRFTRHGPDYRFGDQVDYQEIKQTFGFKTMTIGSWVNDKEKYISANLIYDALADLAQILSVPPSVIGLNNTLNFAFGTGGQKGVQAHYAPSTRTLALAKNAGAGALAHEWWHAFDHYICKHLFDTPSPMSFASSLWLEIPIYNHHPLNLYLDSFFSTAFLSEDGKRPSHYFENAKQLDKQHGSFYFSRPQEMTARAFEACIFYNDNISNDYLVNGIHNSPLQHGGGFPSPETIHTLSKSIFSYFFSLGKALQCR